MTDSELLVIPAFTEYRVCYQVLDLHNDDVTLEANAAFDQAVREVNDIHDADAHEAAVELTSRAQYVFTTMLIPDNVGVPVEKYALDQLGSVNHLAKHFTIIQVFPSNGMPTGFTDENAETYKEVEAYGW